jgi:hypothetical protein
MCADLAVDGKNYNLLNREAWSGQVQGLSIGTAQGIGKMWAYVFKADTGEFLQFVVKYAFTIGTDGNTDNYGVELKMIQKAVETDLEGVKAKTRSKSMYEIDAGISPYKEILEQSSHSDDATGGAGFFIF